MHFWETFEKSLHEPKFDILFTSVKVARTCKGRKLKGECMKEYMTENLKSIFETPYDIWNHNGDGEIGITYRLFQKISF